MFICRIFFMQYIHSFSPQIMSCLFLSKKEKIIFISIMLIILIIIVCVCLKIKIDEKEK